VPVVAYWVKVLFLAQVAASSSRISIKRAKEVQKLKGDPRQRLPLMMEAKPT
jgi:hypothetical protein